MSMLELTLIPRQVLRIFQVVHETSRAQVVDRKGVRWSMDGQGCRCRWRCKESHGVGWWRLFSVVGLKSTRRRVALFLSVVS